MPRNLREIQRFHDKRVHPYFRIKPSVVWQIIPQDLPVLKIAINQLREEIQDNENGKKQP
jgi:uncharacterized protein with HEPN domain